MAELKLIHKGKVRDLYDAGEKYLLIVSSDRLEIHYIDLGTFEYCDGCGREIDTIYAYCPYCGKKVDDKFYVS